MMDEFTFGLHSVDSDYSDESPNSKSLPLKNRQKRVIKKRREKKQRQIKQNSKKIKKVVNEISFNCRKRLMFEQTCANVQSG